MAELILFMLLGCIVTTSPYVSWLHWKNGDVQAAVFTAVVCGGVATAVFFSL